MKSVLPFLILLAIPSLFAFTCPENHPEEGYTCQTSTYFLHVEFRGGNWSQQNFTDYLQQVLRLNYNPGFLTTLDLIIANSPIKSLDLTPLLGFYVSPKLMIENMPNLVEITGPVTNTPYQFNVEYLQILSTANPNARFNLTDLFKAAGSSLKTFDMHNSNFQSLDGLSHLTGLETVSFAANNIGALKAGDLTSSRLELVNLNGNQIIEIGEDVFQPQSVATDLLNTTLNIQIQGNNLTDERIHPNHGLDKTGRPVNLALNQNQFVFLSKVNFEPFLLADERNSISAAGNNFTCDQRMKWLKERRETLEKRVTGVDCQNDPGQTIFTTSLV